MQGKPLEEVNVFKHAVRIHIFFSFSREWRDGVLTVLLRRQAKELRLQETANTKTSGKPLMKWLHLDGTVICSFLKKKKHCTFFECQCIYIARKY